MVLHMVHIDHHLYVHQRLHVFVPDEITNMITDEQNLLYLKPFSWTWLDLYVAYIVLHCFTQ